MLDTSQERPTHMPANPDKFEFDSEVSAIFPNMAKRSIPNYEAFHKLHAELVARWFIDDKPGSRLLDVGASHGAFFTALNQFYVNSGNLPPPMHLEAIDNSPAMCDHLRAMLPDVIVRCEDIDQPAFLSREEQCYDVINCTYVLQFIHPSMQLVVLNKLARMVKPGGILILGQKDKFADTTGFMLHEMYVRWRMANGYTREEIEAKSRALKNAMWPMDRADLVRNLGYHFREVTDTSRMFMFSTLIAFK